MEESVIMITTTTKFWNCNCEHDFFRHECETYCYVCDAEREDNPDSRVDEIEQYLKGWTCSNCNMTYEEITS